MIGGRFEVLQMIRRDFVGTVYRAQDGRSQRDVECLLINLNSEDNHRLLELRAHIHEAKKIRLKSFASTYGIGKQGSDGYIVRQNIEGRPLTDHLNHRSQNHRPFKQRGLCSLLIEVIQALEALKTQEVDVHHHGLIRPSVMMIQNNQKPRVRLTDIGLGLIRSTLIKNHEFDPWTRGCIPELRGEPAPTDPDLYALGALLFQMTQLRPFTQGWLRELSAPPTFSQLPDIIEACTASQPLITLTDLKSELKYAAQSQVEIGGLTRDLSQLQERLQKIIDYEGPEQEAPQDQAPESSAETQEPELTTQTSSNQVEALTSEESVSVIFQQLPGQEEGFEESDHVPLMVTPMPMEVSADLPAMERRANLLSAPAEIRDQLESPAQLPDEQVDDPDPLGSLAEEAEALLSTEGPIDQPSHLSASDQSEEMEVDMSVLNSVMNSMLADEETPEELSADSAQDVLASVEELPELNEVDRVDTLNGADLEELHNELYSSGSDLEIRDQDHTSSEVITPPLPAQVRSSDQSQVTPSGVEGQPNMMDLPMPPLPSLPSQPSFPHEGDLDGQRWIVVRDGRDFGPYTLDELSHQLFREEINLDTEICDIETDARALLGEFTSLDHVLNEWAKERLVRRQRKIERDRKLKARRRILLMLGLLSLGGLVFIGVNYGPEIRVTLLPKPALIDLQSWIQSPPQMKRLERMKENPDKKAERDRLRRLQRVKEETLRTAREMSHEAQLASSATVVNFNKGGKKLAPFSRKGFNRALSSRAGKLMKCIEAESKRAPDRSVFKVTLTVQQSGSFLNAQLVNGSAPGKACVFKAIRKLKMKPFSGGDKTITLPYQLK